MRAFLTGLIFGFICFCGESQVDAADPAAAGTRYRKPDLRALKADTLAAQRFHAPPRPKRLRRPPSWAPSRALARMAQLEDGGADDLGGLDNDDLLDEGESAGRDPPAAGNGNGYGNGNGNGDEELEEPLSVEELIAPPTLGVDSHDWQGPTTLDVSPSVLPGLPPSSFHSHGTGQETPYCPGCAACQGSPAESVPSIAVSSCGGCATCQASGGCRQPCLGKYWFRADYLHWWGSGLGLPPLVTTSPDNTPADEAGELELPNTRILFGGNENHLDDARSGARIRLGMRLGPCSSYGVEGEYFGLEDETDRFFASSGADGSPILARPIFNLVPLVGLPGEDTRLISFAPDISGSIGIELSSEFHSGGIRLRMNVGGSHCGGSCLSCSSSGGSCCGARKSKQWCFDFLAGYRYVELNERIGIEERLVSPIDQFDIRERFEGRNEFHGLELGCLYELRCCRLSMEFLSKVAVGNSRQTVIIDGTTVQTAGGITETFPGGLLAQRTNIGAYTYDELAFVPELGLTVGYQITKFLSANFGYSMVYWSNVARPGQFIDRDVNPNLIPPEVVPVTSPLRPEFTPNRTDFWAHGINFGLEYRI